MALKGINGFTGYKSGLNATDDFYQNIDFINFFQYFSQAVNLIAHPIDGQWANSLGFGATFATANSSAGIGFRFQVNFNAFPLNDVVIALKDSLSTSIRPIQVSVRINPNNNSVEIWRGSPFAGFFNNSGTLLAATGNNAITQYNVHYIEIWVKIDPTVGFVHVYVDDGTLLIGVDNVNTQNTAENTFDQVIWASNTGSSVNVGDLYYMDTTTGAGDFPCNGPVGDSHIFTAFPVGNDQAQWSPNPNTNANWQNVKETAMDSDTTYNASSTAGQEDRFNMQSLTGVVSAIFGAKIRGAYRKDDAGTRTIKQALKSGTTEVYGANNNLPSSAYEYIGDLFVLNPANSLSWDNVALNAVKVGYNLVA